MEIYKVIISSWHKLLWKNVRVARISTALYTDLSYGFNDHSYKCVQIYY